MFVWVEKAFGEAPAPKGSKRFMDLKKALDKVPQGVLWVCGLKKGHQGLALSNPALEYSSRGVIIHNQSD